MKLFQRIMSPGFHRLAGFSLKTLTKDSSYKMYAARSSHNASFPTGLPISNYLAVSKFHTTSCAKTATENLSLSPSKKRLQKKKAQQLKDDMKGPIYSAVAYSTAQRYKMVHLVKGLENQGLYQCLPLPAEARDDLHICVKNTDPVSHIYIFSEGSVVFWNIPESQRKEMLNFLKPYEINSYDEALVVAEEEDLDYIYSEDETRLYDGFVILNSKSDADLHTYAFSNSLAQSVKLGILEAVLENYSDSIGWVTEKMTKGEKLKMSRAELFAKRGELFSISHAINLSSDLLDTPDFYWDRKDLESLYLKTRNYLDIPLRTKTMNLRLNYCSELVDLLVNHMNDEHHVRLEWMIIILIMVEVVFECAHFLEKFSH